MKIPRKGSSLKQAAYARRVWGADGENKKQIALDVGYSPAVANSVVSKIESRPGFNNAIAALAAKSNNLAMTVMSEFEARGLEDFSNKDLVAALNAIGNAWERFNKGLMESAKPVDSGKNRLKTVILQQIENQTVMQAPAPEKAVEKEPETASEDPGF